MTTHSRKPDGRRGFSPPPQYDPYAAQLGQLSERIHRVLTERECAIFDRGLADYHRRRNVKAFVECLSLVLNTNSKRQLLLPIRDTYVKPSDISKFNQLVQVHGLALSLKRKTKPKESKANEGIHKIEVKRDLSGDWGFSIRGGSEYGIGIFVSWVDPGSSAQKNGLQVGDQILKAGDANFESISHYEAVQLMNSSNKLRLWVLSHGRVPSSHMAHKVYRWVDSEGRPTTPPPDPFEIMEQKSRGGSNRLLSEADERKVTVVVDAGRELGISIRGGAEHGLGIYISAVEEGSVADIYGVKVGDQVLEVNGISFLGIVHSDAANALRAQPCMVMRLKDVGKLPHSRITTYGQTQWHSPPSTPGRNKQQEVPPSPVFTQGMGTQVMLKKQDRSIPGDGMMNEVARSVLSAQELSTFHYYINQYRLHGLPVEDLVTPLLDLLNTPEKLQLLSEVRTIIVPRDLQQFNELTVRREIAAKKATKKSGGSWEGSLTGLPQKSVKQITAHIHNADTMMLSPTNVADLSFGSEDQTLTPGENGDGSDEGGRDHVPQRLSPPHRRPVAGVTVFHAPPPPAPATSTPENHSSPDPQSVLADTLKERRKWMQSEAREDETWGTQWNESTLSSIQSGAVVPRRRPGAVETAGPGQGVRISVIERKVRSETEDKLRKEFEEKERRMLEEQQRLLEEEQQQREQLLRQERETMEQQLREVETRVREEVEEHVRREAEDEMRRQLEEKEREIAEEHARKLAEEQQRREQMQQEAMEQQIHQVEEHTKQELEEKIWKEAEEHMREEFEARMQREREMLTQQATQQQQEVEEETARKLQQRIYREAEQKYKQEYEQKMQREIQRKTRQVEEEHRRKEEDQRRRKEEEERMRREAEVARLEAEEQARIELEERIRREVEAKARAEYEERLQRETEERARLAEEVKARRAAEERLEQERREYEQETQRRRQEAEQRQQAQKEEQEQHRRRQQEEAQQRRRQQIETEERQRQEAQRRQRQQLETEERQRQETQRRQRQQLETEERQRQEAQRRQRQQLETEERRKAQQRRQQLQEEEERQLQQKQEEEEQHRHQEEELQQQHAQLTQEEKEEQHRLEVQRQRREEEKREQERREQEEERAAREEQKRREAEKKRKQELERKREENLRRKEEERKQRELEQKKKWEEDKKKKQQGEQRRPGFNIQHVKVNFGDQEPTPKKPAEKSRAELVEEERRRAEEKLQRRLERKRLTQMNAKKETTPAATVATAATENKNSNPPLAAGAVSKGKEFGDYTNLHGEILKINVTKVCKRLGIAIDGGANTKQKAVIIREISPDGCAALTGTGMKVGQQILQIEGTSLKGLKHRETVMAIKSAFEGPMDKTIEFVLLDPQTEE